MKNILIAIDFDPKTKKLLELSAEIAAKFKSKLWIVHVAAPEPDFVGYHLNSGIEYVDLQRADDLRKEHKTIQRCAETLNKKGLQATGLLVQGATVKTVLEECKKLKI